MFSRCFQDVIVWQQAHRWVLDIYKFTEKFPKHEMFGLTSQLRRAAISIPANFAEGFGKRTKPEKARFYNIAQGSIEECRYYMILAQDLNYGSTTKLLEDLNSVAYLLVAYLRGLQQAE